jgi:hypothetical protein
MAYGNGMVFISKNTITKNACTNMSSSEGGGVTAYSGPNILGENNIIYGNTAASYPECYTYGTGSSINLNYCCSSQILAGTGNITSNPQFADPGNLNFCLLPASPCIDNGNPISPPDPDGTRVDMGAICYIQHGTIALSSNSLLFPQTAIGSEDTLQATIYNQAQANLIIRDITNNFPNIFDALWNPLDSIITGGDSLVIDVIFSPVNQTLYTDNLLIENNDTPVTIQLEGSGMISGIVGGLNNTVPTEYALSQAYPNPFNPATTIRYQLPHAANVRLVVYNALGQKVRTLVNSHMEAGYHQLSWHGNNDIGMQMPSGVYMFRIETKNYQAVHKMMLMK